MNVVLARTIVKRFSRRSGLLLVLAASFLAGIQGTRILTPSDASATHCGSSTQQSRFSGQASIPAAYGIDGYMQYAPGTLSDPSCNKVVMGLFVNTSNRLSFIQVGIRQGYQTETISGLIL